MHWRKVSINLPGPLFDFFTTVSDDYLLVLGGDNVILGGDNVVRRPNRGVCKLPIATIIALVDQPHSETHSRWICLAPVTHSYAALIPSSSPPMIFGGWNHRDKASADIKIYDNSDHSWKKIGSLASPKCAVGLAAVHDIIIGGCSEGEHKADYKSCLILG